ncbi:MAG: hypothetical protein WDM89_13610 [Rhizomicrobium sp.]
MARLAADRHAIGHQLRDVAIDRARGRFEFFRDLMRGDRPALAAQAPE